MLYKLSNKADRNQPVATADCRDEFAAEKWAREWANNQDRLDDLILESDDGSYKASLFRTVAGQWYIMGGRQYSTAAA